MGVHGRPGRSAPGRNPARHAVHRRHGGAGERAGGQGHGLRDAGRRLPGGLEGGRVRPPRAAVARFTAGGGTGRGQRGQAVPPGLRALEEGQEGRAELGVAVGAGPAGLAHRVCGDVARPARRGVRPARRWAGSEVPPPRERAGAGRRRRQGLRPALDASRLGRGRGHEDVEVPRQLLDVARSPVPQRRPRLPAPRRRARTTAHP